MRSCKRKSLPLTIEQFKEIILAKASHTITCFDEEFDFNLKFLFSECHKLSNDIKEIAFGIDRWETTIGHGYYNTSLCGLHTLDNGLSFMGVTTCGRNELPMLFIIYYDRKDLRCYIPQDGNIYNKITKTAFGREACSGIKTYSISDKDKIKEMFPHIDDNSIINALWKSCGDVYAVSKYFLEWHVKKFDDNAIIIDIKRNIEIQNCCTGQNKRMITILDDNLL